MSLWDQKTSLPIKLTSLQMNLLNFTSKHTSNKKFTRDHFLLKMGPWDQFLFLLPIKLTGLQINPCKFTGKHLSNKKINS